MISVLEAEKIINENTLPFSDTTLPLSAASGLVLRESVCSDRDLPPFDRVMMDGIAVAFRGWDNTGSFYKVEALSKAGEVRKVLRDFHNAVEVTTGCVLPEGCDVVIRYEDLEKKPGGFAVSSGVVPKQWQNVHRQGTDVLSGDTLLEKGVLLNGPCLGVLASVGKVGVLVAARPKIAFLSTGDELVDSDQVPKPYQIRKSNASAIQGILKDLGYSSFENFHAKDDYEDLQMKAKEALSRNDLLILSGGVSMGKADFVPEVLRDLGVTILFHKVAMRPGKPLLFGKTQSGKQVFGLPGNPVSALVCLSRYILPALDQALGRVRKLKDILLEEVFKMNPSDFTVFVPVRLRIESGCVWAKPCPTNTSGDFSSLAKSDGFIELQPGKSHFSKGDVLPFFSWGGIL